MSFFGFDTNLPRDRAHQTTAPGFAAPQDAFASLSNEPADNEALEFEETYEGYGGAMDDAADDLNLDTFGEESSVGKDFDFAGQTGGVNQAIEEERMVWAAQHAPGHLSAQPKRADKSKSAYRTGYEAVKLVPDLEVDADLWGTAPVKQEPEPERQSRKPMTLEEVEAMMLSQQSHQPPPPQMMHQPPPQYGHPPPQQHPQILQRPPQMPPQMQQQMHEQPYPQHPPHPQVPQILQRPHPPPQEHQVQPVPTGPRQHRQQQSGSHQHAPRQILQNPNRQSGRQGHAKQPSYGGPVLHPNQIAQLSEADRAAYHQEEARRNKRNSKIQALSKYNGLMTPQDKNFITRIQLQQLVTATGTVDAQGPESLLNDDFYYQVYRQIRGAPRQNPHQPANQFAQTYLFQTGGRYGHNRRHPRGGENHMQRMEQQVARAVEAAKAKPKNSQLVIEGSLGKISFSNSKTPKPLLNLKRPEGEARPNAAAKKPLGPQDAAAERRDTLNHIEKVYTCLMAAEDLLRQEPRGPSPAHEAWSSDYAIVAERLWRAFRADVPINQNRAMTHPFIAILSHAKGKKALSRAWNLFPPQQRTILVTIIIVHLDTLDVVHNALAWPIPVPVKDEIVLFINTVYQRLWDHISEAEFHIVTGLLGLIISRSDLRTVARTEVGLVILTGLISRAEVLKEGLSQPSPEQQQSLQEYAAGYTAIFNAIEPILPTIFPETSPLSSEDVYVWHFLAAMGAAANPEQQQRLVIGVKDRVMSAVQAARTLPNDAMEKRKGEVNIFMRALGLDVDLLMQ